MGAITTRNEKVFFVKRVEAVGTNVFDLIKNLGRFMLFAAETFKEVIRPPHRLTAILDQMEFIGSRSLNIILLSAIAIGAVFGLQIGIVFSLFKAEGILGVATAQALTRELAPVMTAFLISGRAGSSMTAELSTMKVNEQIDAMEAMGVSPINYLVVPRLIAAMIVTPMLSAIFLFVGVLGSFVVGIVIFDVDQGVFFSKIFDMTNPSDIAKGLEKAFVFSVVIIMIACHYGLKASGGAKGVGMATTNSVITTLLVLLCVDLCMTYLQTFLL